MKGRQILSISSAAKYCGYSREMLEYWMDCCGLQYEQPPTPGKKYNFRRIRTEDLDSFLELYRKRHRANNSLTDLSRST
jgi:hypothetical protein